jgi:copper transport protein
MSNPAAGVEPISWPAQRTEDGVWQATDVVIPIPGEWDVQLEAVMVLGRATMEGSVTIRG